MWCSTRSSAPARPARWRSKLGRRWIGIERDAEYVRIAQERIDAIPASAPDAALDLPDRRKAPRLPFGALLERGLLQPGQPLFFRDQRETCRDDPGRWAAAVWRTPARIHQVARAIQVAPCNGWEHWYYADPSTGELQPIDALRQRVLGGRHDVDAPDS